MPKLFSSLVIFLMLCVSYKADTLEIIDLYDPASMAYLGSEKTWYNKQQLRTKLEITDKTNAQTLLFLVEHDEQQREAKATYYELGAKEPSTELFTYSDDGKVKTTTYFNALNEQKDVTVSELNDKGREVYKRYYNSKGQLYGTETVSWLNNGDKDGWEFKYAKRDGGAAFTYTYTIRATDDNWQQRLRTRDGKPERIEVRTIVDLANKKHRHTTIKFAHGTISTKNSETSPSFSDDGKKMVFARYTEWDKKTGYLALRH